MGVDHVEMPLVDRQVDRLAEGPAAVMQSRAHVGQLGEVPEVLDRRVAATRVGIPDEGRAVRGSEHRVGIADGDRMGRVAGVLDE